jgi:hypothetical protein
MNNIIPILLMGHILGIGLLVGQVLERFSTRIVLGLLAYFIVFYIFMFLVLTAAPELWKAQ